METRVLHGAGELCAAIPVLLGFTPVDSVVMVALTARGEVAGVMRVNRADCMNENVSSDVARATLRMLDRVQPHQLVLVSFTDETVELLCPAAEYLRSVIAVVVDKIEVWAVTEGNFYAPGCARVLCCPPGGRPVPEPVLRSGQYACAEAPEHSPRGLTSRVNSRVGEAQKRRVQRAGERFVHRRVAGTTWRREAYGEWSKAGAAARRGSLPSDVTSGRLIYGIRDARVRDAVIVGLIPGHASTARSMVRHSPPPQIEHAMQLLLDPHQGVRPRVEDVMAMWELGHHLLSVARHGHRAPLLTLCGVVAWWDRETDVASQLLEDAQGVDPDYRLARLLGDVVSAGIMPGWARM